MEPVFYCVLLGFFWVFFILPLYPFVLLIAIFGRITGANDFTFWQFTKEWFTFRFLLYG